MGVADLPSISVGGLGVQGLWVDGEDRQISWEEDEISLGEEISRKFLKKKKFLGISEIRISNLG